MRLLSFLLVLSQLIIISRAEFRKGSILLNDDPIWVVGGIGGPDASESNLIIQLELDNNYEENNILWAYGESSGKTDDLNETRENYGRDILLLKLSLETGELIESFVFGGTLNERATEFVQLEWDPNLIYVVGYTYSEEIGGNQSDDTLGQYSRGFICEVKTALLLNSRDSMNCILPPPVIATTEVRYSGVATIENLKKLLVVGSEDNAPTNFIFDLPLSSVAPKDTSITFSNPTISKSVKKNPWYISGNSNEFQYFIHGISEGRFGSDTPVTTEFTAPYTYGILDIPEDGHVSESDFYFVTAVSVVEPPSGAVPIFSFQDAKIVRSTTIGPTGVAVFVCGVTTGVIQGREGDVAGSEFAAGALFADGTTNTFNPGSFGYFQYGGAKNGTSSIDNFDICLSVLGQGPVIGNPSRYMITAGTTSGSWPGYEENDWFAPILVALDTGIDPDKENPIVDVLIPPKPVPKPPHSLESLRDRNARSEFTASVLIPSTNELILAGRSLFSLYEGMPDSNDANSRKIFILRLPTAFPIPENFTRDLIFILITLIAVAAFTVFGNISIFSTNASVASPPLSQLGDDSSKFYSLEGSTQLLPDQLEGRRLARLTISAKHDPTTGVSGEGDEDIQKTTTTTTSMTTGKRKQGRRGSQGSSRSKGSSRSQGSRGSRKGGEGAWKMISMSPLTNPALKQTQKFAFSKDIKLDRLKRKLGQAYQVPEIEVCWSFNEGKTLVGLTEQEDLSDFQAFGAPYKLYVFPKKRNWFTLISVCLAMYDFVTDVLFARSLAVAAGTNDSFLLPFIFSVGFLSISVITSAIVVVSMIKHLAKHDEWFKVTYSTKFTGLYNAILLISLTNLDLLAILYSNLPFLGLDTIKMLYSSKRKLLQLGYNTLFLEDLPLLSVQLYVFFFATPDPSLSSILIFSLIGTIAMIFLSLSKRLLSKEFS